MASAYNNLGMLYYSCMDVDRAQALHERTLAIRQNLNEGLMDPAGLSYSSYPQFLSTAPRGNVCHLRR
ncbi:tetratricopeptide repeat protein [Prosthecobacter sp.]|uniref:tetratricopeptide repeat protein n=1 Tax=Prosthecobacter sp. TaxID=1965333 RepID=UPI00378347AC